MAKHRTVLLFTALFLTQILAGVYLARSLEAQGTLTAEESAIAHSDNAFFEERFQHNPLATSFGAQFFYWVGYKVAPGDSIFFARYWKAAFMALLSPLLFLYAKKKLGLSEFAAAASATVAGLLPAWMAFVWLCGVGLELVAGLAALLLLDSRKTAPVILSGALVGLSPLIYEAGFVFFPLYFLELFLILREAWGKPEQKRLLAAAAGAVVLIVLVMLSPAIWWVNEPRLYLGGGEIVNRWGALFARNWKVFVRDVFQWQEKSYYFFSVAPGLSNVWLMSAIGVGMAATIPRWRKWWPIYLLGAMSFAINMIAGGTPGIRRVLILLVLFTLGTGVLLDLLYAYALAKAKKTIALAACAALAFTFVVGPAWQVEATADAFRDGSLQLPNDIKLLVLEGKTLAETVDYMLTNPYAGVALNLRSSLEPTRPLGLLYVMAKRRGLASATDFKAAALDFWNKSQPRYRSIGTTTYY